MLILLINPVPLRLEQRLFRLELGLLSLNSGLDLTLGFFSGFLRTFAVSFAMRCGFDLLQHRGKGGIQFADEFSLVVDFDFELRHLCVLSDTGRRYESSRYLVLRESCESYACRLNGGCPTSPASHRAINGHGKVRAVYPCRDSRPI